MNFEAMEWKALQLRNVQDFWGSFDTALEHLVSTSEEKSF